MIIGTIMIHTHLFCVWLMYIVLIVFLVIARALVPKFLTPSRLKYLLRRCIFHIAFFGSFVLILFSIVEYSFQPPDLKEILWKGFSCRQSRDSVRVALWFILCDYWDWKSDQIDHFHQLASNILNILMTAFESSLETWNAMCLMRKLVRDSVYSFLLANRDNSPAHRGSCRRTLWSLLYRELHQCYLSVSG
jgi:hypothetical protein